MKKDDMFNFDSNWQDLWVQQGKAFYDTANAQLKDLFDKNKTFNPEQHTEQLSVWLNTLKAQWDKSAQKPSDTIFQNYWQFMAKLCGEASDSMMKEWIKRTQENNPINNIRELYELWLNCCNEKYQQAIQTKSFQDTYANFINAALKAWQQG